MIMQFNLAVEAGVPQWISCTRPADYSTSLIPWSWEAYQSGTELSDTFASRQRLAEGETTGIWPSTINSTYEEGETVTFADTRGSVWTSWRAPRTGPVFLSNPSVHNSVSAIARLGVYQGSDLASLQLVGSSEIGLSARLAFQAIENTDYAIAVYPSDGNLAALRLQLGAPPNDAFEDAIDLGSARDVLTSVNTIGATVQDDEPSYQRLETFPGIYPIGSVWWRWTAPADGQLNFQVRPLSDERFAPGFPMALTLFEGNSLDKLRSVSSDRVHEGRVYYLGFAYSRGGGGDVAVSLSLIENARSRGFDLRVDQGSLETSKLYVHESSAARGTVAWSRSSGLLLPSLEDLVGNGSSHWWWQWQAPRAGVMTLTQEAGNTFRRLTAFRGSRFDALTMQPLTGELGRLEIPVEAGEIYQFALSAADTARVSPDILQFSLRLGDGSGYSSWSAAAFPNDPNAQGAMADPDGDRLVNLVEYALGTAPETPNHSVIRLARDGSLLLPLATLPDDVILTYQASDDLQHWIDLTEGPDYATSSEGDALRVAFTSALDDRARYIRLRLELR